MQGCFRVRKASVLPSYCFIDCHPHQKGHLQVQYGCSGHHICIPASRKVLNKKTVCLKLPTTSAYILLPKLNHKTTLATKEKKMKSLLWVIVCQHSHSILLKEGNRDIGAVFVMVCMSHPPSMETFVASLFQRFMEQL